MMGRYLLSKFNLIYTIKGVLGPKLLLAMGCGNKVINLRFVTH